MVAVYIIAAGQKKKFIGQYVGFRELKLELTGAHVLTKFSAECDGALRS
jgi:hypothetical protein